MSESVKELNVSDLTPKPPERKETCVTCGKIVRVSGYKTDKPYRCAKCRDE